MKSTIAMGSLLLTVSACGAEAPDVVPAVPPPPPAVVSAAQAPAAPVAVEPPKPAAPDTGGFALVAPSSLQYQPANPAGPGPEIAFVHGDPKTGGAFFLRSPAGAKAGVHTHTSDYKAVVVSGAPKHWLPGSDAKAKPLDPGSFWFQPGGQPHGDECTGKDPCVLFIVMSGPLDFLPAPNAKAGPVGKYSLTARKDEKLAPMDPSKPGGPKLAVTFGDPKSGPVAFLLETPAGANVGMHRHTNDYLAVVVDGAPAHWLPDQSHEGDPLTPGTYWFQPGGYDHGDRCSSATPCHMFVFLDKALDFLPPKVAVATK